MDMMLIKECNTGYYYNLEYKEANFYLQTMPELITPFVPLRTYFAFHFYHLKKAHDKFKINKKMPKKKLTMDDLLLLNELFLRLSGNHVNLGNWSNLHSLVAAEILTKIRVKIARGAAFGNGYIISLTPAQVACLKQAQSAQVFNQQAEVANALFRFMQQNL